MARGLAGALQPDVIEQIVHKFAFPPAMHEVRLSQNPQVLGGDGLFDPEGGVYFVDARGVSVVDNAANLHTERMGQGPENVGRRTQVATVLEIDGRGGRGEFIHAGRRLGKIQLFVFAGKYAIYL